MSLEAFLTAKLRKAAGKVEGKPGTQLRDGERGRERTHMRERASARSVRASPAPRRPPRVLPPPGAIRSVLGDAGGGAGGSGGFTHPGTLMGPREVALLQRRVRGGELPWADAAVTLSSETPRGYT